MASCNRKSKDSLKTRPTSLKTILGIDKQHEKAQQVRIRSVSETREDET